MGLQRAAAGAYGARQSTVDDQIPEVHSGTCGFQHEALFYAGERGFLDGTLPFVNDALAAGEPLMVAVRDVRARLLERALGGEAERVRFVDIDQLARNPARIIPAWSDYINEPDHDGRPVRVLAEAVWAGRSNAELSECQRYESLLNLAFQQGPQWRLLCSYDLDALTPAALDAAQLSHPFIARDGGVVRGARYLAPDSAPSPFAGSLPDPAGATEELSFTAEGLALARQLVSRRALDAQLGEEAREDLVLAINELVTNSVQHGGGRGVLRIWTEGDSLVCEVRDRGRIVDPLAGRVPPPLEQHGGRGLWLVNHLCDLVQIRSGSSGSTVRVFKR